MKSYFKDYEEKVLDYIRKREEKKRQLLLQYELDLKEYNSKMLQFSNRSLFRKLIGGPVSDLKEPIMPDLSDFDKTLDFPYVQVGQRFAVKYSDIVGTIAELKVTDNTFYTPTVPVDETRRRIETNRCSTIHDEMDGISDLWTVVEYVGNGLYKDLLTDMIFSIPTLTEEIGDTVTQSTERKNRSTKDRLLQYPLSIDSKEVVKTKSFYSRGSYQGYVIDEPVFDGLFPMLYFLTPDVQEQILEKSVPKREEIKNILLEVAEKERKYIEEYYRNLNLNTINEYYDDAMEVARVKREEELEVLRKRQEEIARIEAARKEAEEARRREEEEARRNQEQAIRNQQIMAEFNEFFGETDSNDGITVNSKVLHKIKK